jgi:predicted RecA/RadA family phage recombinase
MPYNRPGRGVYVTNETASAALTHGQPVKEGNFVGIAVKQVSPGFDSTIADATTIEDNEEYFLVTKGVVQVDKVTGFAKGETIYITSANALTETSSSNTKFGTVVETENERGTPTGKVRIDLDLK